MGNPCKICIVTAICNEECDELVDYLHERLQDNYQPGYRFVAGKYRKGELILVEDDTAVAWAEPPENPCLDNGKIMKGHKFGLVMEYHE